MKSIKFVPAAIALAAGVFAMGNAHAQAANGGTMTFNGAVIDATCTVRGGSGSDGGQGNFTVALDPVPATSLTAAGATANRKPFSVVIGGPGQGSCVNGKVARLSFVPSSPRIDAATGTLNNALPNEAANTNIQILDSTNTPINLASVANGVNSPVIADNTTTINLGAQYYATGAATAGQVSTNVQYGVTYN